MNPRRIQRSIYITAASTAGCAAAVVAAGLWIPAGVAGVESPPVIAASAERDTPESLTPSNEAQGSSAEAAASLDRIYQLTAIDLRRPLYDAPPAAPLDSGEASTAPSHTLQLVGTVIETPDRSYAIFQRSDGTIAFVPTGGSIDDVVGPVTVKTVESHAATIEYRGASHTLILPKEQILGVEP